MKILSRDLKKQAAKIISYEKKDVIPLTNEENEPYRKQKVCHICKKEFSTNGNDKNYYKLREHCHYTGKYRGAAHNVCNLRHKTLKKIHVVFHSG